MIKKFACFTGWLLLLCLSLLFCFTLGSWKNWSTPGILMLWLAILLLVILVRGALQGIQLVIKGNKGRVLLGKYRLSRREYVLREHWKFGANIIKRIRRQRTPFSWFLLTGERCGKSTLLASSGVPRFYDDSDDTVACPTRTLRWWFFRRIGILDLSSNFLTGNASFRQSWRKLAFWCARLPAPAGIIIALPMEKLIAADRSALHTLARQQRAFVEPLIRRFGHRLPLFILITQSDTFPGFSLWQQQLSSAQRQQPLGYCWSTPPHIDGQDATTLSPLFSTLKQGMSRVRLSMAFSTSLGQDQHASLLDFPEKFAGIEPALRYTLASLCESNAYFSASSLGGIWFSASEPQPDNRGRRTGVFIRDLLSQRLADLCFQPRHQPWYRRSRGKKCCATVLVAATLWLITSSVFSFERLHPSLHQETPDALARFLAKDERPPGSWLRYLPFQPLLSQQFKRASSLLAQTPGTSRQAPIVFADYQRHVVAASPEAQRELILHLADAIILWQQMRNGATLDTLMQVPPTTSELRQRLYPENLAPLTVLAIERHYMQSQNGKRWLQAAQSLLAQLIDQTSPLNWLTAHSATIPDISAGNFWPNLTSGPTLKGIWSQEGKRTVDGWIARLEQALEQPESSLQHVSSAFSTLRQDAWKQYLVNTTASLSNVSPVILPGVELLALGEDRSPAMRFAHRIQAELKDISPSDTQPWLSTLRQLQLTAKKEESTALSNNIALFDRHLRESLTAWLKNQPAKTPSSSVLSVQPLWKQWKTARNAAVNEALTLDKSGPRLTDGLFISRDEGNRNPLKAMLPALSSLQERLSPQNTDSGIAAVWSLYKDDANRLLGNAMAQSACWLNNQWKSTVIWPLGNGTEQHSYEEQQALSQQFINEFLRGPATNLLSMGSRGPVPAGYGGMKLPLSAAFLQLAGQEYAVEQTQSLPKRASTRAADKQAFLQAKIDLLHTSQKSLEKKSWKTSVTSLPATIPGGARIIPTGTQLTLQCLTGDQQLSSMNFAEQHEFNWQPGQCSGLTINVIFPDFTASYQINGDDVWPWFINRFSAGSALLDSRDFGNSRDLLESLGINQILVRFSISAPHDLETAFQTWSEQDAALDELNERIATINMVRPIRPISALPTNIAQCQSL